ncbi:MAG TPA: hypothetical protein VJJ20_00120 [Candidatus Paceibacterota bacterium]
MGLFSKKPPTTALILDIENGSVGSCLVKLAPGQAPQLFGEARTAVPLMDTRSAASLSRAVEHAASESLLQASEVAARLRHYGGVAPVSRVVLFLSAPWGVPNLQAGRPDFITAITDTLAPRIASLFGGVPTAVHAHASAAVHGLRALYPHEPNALLVSVNGEVSELIVLKDSHVAGHATVPIGLGHILRTLKAHAGLSEHEARSAMRLHHMNEALAAAAGHFAGEFKHAAHDLFTGQGSSTVFVLAPETTSEWFARSLAHPSLVELFPQGGIVRTLRSHHAAPYVSASHAPDIHLSLNAMYTSAALGHNHRGEAHRSA